ncbi:MAG TPA: ABC transporter permease subunit [Methylomirabilota bacterium]|nr:ABC transporter permease subunit [Methylomirabilota bacterium]
MSTGAAAFHPAVSAARPRAAWAKGWPLLPALGFLLLFFVYPVGQLLWLSVTDRGGALTGQHYVRLFSSSLYLDVLLITLKISAWTTVFALVGGYPVAYLLATSNASWRGRLMFWVLLPFWTSFLVRAFAWMVLLGRNGALNKLLQATALTDAPIQVIFNLTGVLIGMTHALMPLAILTMVSVMESIDANLPKAAATLGARGGQAFWRIYFPISLPGVAAAGLLVFISAAGFFIIPALLGGRRETMITQIIIEQVQDLMNWAFAGAISVLLLVAALLVFYLYDRALGMSTLAGSTLGRDRHGTGGENPIARVSAWVGRRLIAALGWLADRTGDIIERAAPVRGDRPRRAWARGLLAGICVLIVVFLALPAFFMVPVSFTSEGFIDWPPKGFSLKWYRSYLESAQWMAATVRSLVVGVAAATLATLLGVPAAFALARRTFAGKTAGLALVLSPLIIPRVILAVALFYLYARIGLVGTSLGLILGHAVLAIPFVVVTVMAVLKNYDERLDQAAASLGAGPASTLYHVTLPLIRAGLIVSFLFAFVTSFDELTIALFVTGGLTTTLPKQMWDDALLKVTPTLAAVSTVLIVFVAITIFLAERLRQRSIRA